MGLVIDITVMGMDGVDVVVGGDVDVDVGGGVDVRVGEGAEVDVGGRVFGRSGVKVGGGVKVGKGVNVGNKTIVEAGAIEEISLAEVIGGHCPPLSRMRASSVGTTSGTVVSCG